MITYIQGNGTLIKSVPDKFYQGSSYANTIYFVGAFPQSSVVKIAFKLPQTGHYTQPYVMLNADIQTDIGINAWYFDVPVAITEYFGEVEFQVQVLGGTKTKFVGGIETPVPQVIASGFGTFEVEKGVEIDASDIEAPDVYDQILQLIAQIQAKINNHNLIAKGILPYDNIFEYPINAIVLENGNFYKSLVANNIGNAVTDPTKWQKIVLANEELNTKKLDKSVTENGVTSTFDRYGNIGGGLNNRPYIRTQDNNNNSGAEVKIYSSGSQEQFQIDVYKATENNQYKYSNIFVSPTEIRLKNDQDVVGRTKELKITDQKVTINNKEVATETEIDNVQNGVDQNSYDIGQLSSQIVDLQNITPSQATPSNKLATEDFVNSSINNIASFYITKNAQGNPFESYAELISTSTYYSGGEVRVPTRNDYCIIREDETHDDATTRYSYQNGQWEFQYIVNETPLTQAQLKALNSGITAELVEQIQQGASQPASETVLGTVRFWADADGTLRMSTLPYVEPTSPIASDTTYCADSLICDE